MKPNFVQKSVKKHRVVQNSEVNADVCSDQSESNNSVSVKSKSVQKFDKKYRVVAQNRKVKSNVRSVQSKSNDDVSEVESRAFTQSKPNLSVRSRDKLMKQCESVIECGSSDDEVKLVATTRAVSANVAKPKTKSKFKSVRRDVVFDQSNSESDVDEVSKKSVKSDQSRVVKSKNKSADRFVEMCDESELCGSECDVVENKNRVHVCADVKNDKSRRSKSVGKLKSKSNHRRAVDDVDVDGVISSDDGSVVRKKCVADCHSVKGAKNKQMKSAETYNANENELKRSVCDSAHVSAKRKSENLNHRKMKPNISRTRTRSHHMFESDSETDDASCSVTKRGMFIKPEKFNGASPNFETFRAHFQNAVTFNKWNEREQLAFLKSSLTGSAAQCLWDNPDATDTLEKLWKLLADRFGGQNLTEKYRTELRNRRRHPGESLDSLCQDVRRLLILGYPGPTSSAHEAIARDSFIDALSDELSLKIRERDPPNLDAALHLALRLEAIHQTNPTHDVNEDIVRAKGRARAVSAGTNLSNDNQILSPLNELANRFDALLKTMNGRMDSFESTLHYLLTYLLTYGQWRRSQVKTGDKY